MRAEESITQRINLYGQELATEILIIDRTLDGTIDETIDGTIDETIKEQQGRDGGEARPNMIDLSIAVFEQIFEPGSRVSFVLEDNTQGREKRFYFGLSAEIHYQGNQSVPIRLTLGTNYRREDIEPDLTALKELQKNEAGQYAFVISQRINHNQS